jgi:hypothetical protein
LQSRFGTIDKWIDSIKGQQKSDEVEIQRQWGSDLQGYIHSTNLIEGSRFVLVQAVKSFLKEYLNLSDYTFTLVTKDQHLAEKKRQQEQNPKVSKRFERWSMMPAPGTEPSFLAKSQPVLALESSYSLPVSGRSMSMLFERRRCPSR